MPVEDETTDGSSSLLNLRQQNGVRGVHTPSSAINQNTASGKAEPEEVNLLTVSYHKPMLIISAEHGELCPLAQCACLQTWALEREREREWQDVSKIKIERSKYNKVRNNE